MYSKRFTALNFHVVETSTTLWLAKEFIEDYWDKANCWKTSLGKPWQRQQPSISSNLQPAHWHMTWLSMPNRQQLVIATMLHTIKHWGERVSSHISSGAAMSLISHLSHGASLQSQGLKIMVQFVHRPHLWTDKTVGRDWERTSYPVSHHTTVWPPTFIL